MTGANTPPAFEDLARLVDKVQRLERKLDRFGADNIVDLDDVHAPQKSAGDTLVWNDDENRFEVGAIAVSDGIWELTGTGRKSIHPLDSLADTGDPTDEGVNWFTLDLKAPQGNSGTTGDIHVTSFYVAPGIGAGGGDVQAETFIDGQDAVMDWFYWCRNGGGSRGYEAGSFWDAIAAVTDGANSAEAFFEVYADAKLAILELLAYLPVSPHYYAELDIVLELDDPDNPVAYFDFYGHANGANAFLWFEANRYAGSGPFPMAPAPDAKLGASDWTIGYDGSDFILKVNDGGIKTVVLTPT